MKTKEQIKTRIELLTKQSAELKPWNSFDDKKVYNKNKRELKFIREVLMYLETDPTQQFVDKQLKMIKDRSASLDSQFVYNGKDAEERKLRYREYRKAMELPKMDRQIKTLSYIAK
jgi:hypothetical protein